MDLILHELGHLPLTREEVSLFLRLLVREYERVGLIMASDQLDHAMAVNIRGGSTKKPGLLGRKPRPVDAETAAAVV